MITFWNLYKLIFNNAILIFNNAILIFYIEATFELHKKLIFNYVKTTFDLHKNSFLRRALLKSKFNLKTI